MVTIHVAMGSILGMLLAAATSAHAQPSIQLDKVGQWAGPYDLALDPPFNSNYLEITHAALLPFDDGQVILWCRDQCGGVGYTETYLWAVATPGAVGVVPVPGASSHNNLFCAGHTWDRDGRLVVVGGNDYLAGLSGNMQRNPQRRHRLRLRTRSIRNVGPDLDGGVEHHGRPTLVSNGHSPGWSLLGRR